MGIAGDKPRQLAPTVGTTGSGSTGSPAPSSSSATSPAKLHRANFFSVHDNRSDLQAVFMLFRYTRGRRARQQIHFSALDYVINNLLQPDPLVLIVSGGRIWLSRLHRVRSTPSTTS
jgi:hypothetical protein